MAHCLIVDDSRVIRTVARRIFEGLHFVTAEAEDGMAALRSAREKMPDLILLDWSMPGMTGLEFVRSLRAQPEGGRPIILVSTTEMDANEIAQGVAAGIDDYIMKPFDRETLSAKLAEVQRAVAIRQKSPPVPDMAPDDFAFLARLVHRRAGIVLTDSRRALIERRLAPVMRRFGFKDLGAMLRDLRLGREALAVAVTEAMTVNETSFFRDAEFFHRLGKEILPALLAARDKEKRLRIWSAACAAGQEAYSLAMILDSLGLAADGWNIDFVATDISAEAIGRAERGHYNFFETQRGLSEGDLAVWFQAEAGGYTIADHIRRMVQFRKFNLLDSCGWLDELDLVLCRNVLIYFDGATQSAVLDRIGGAMAPGALLALGDAESAMGAGHLFDRRPGGQGLYVRAKNPPRYAAAV